MQLSATARFRAAMSPFQPQQLEQGLSRKEAHTEACASIRIRFNRILVRLIFKPDRGDFPFGNPNCYPNVVSTPPYFEIENVECLHTHVTGRTLLEGDSYSMLYVLLIFSSHRHILKSLPLLSGVRRLMYDVSSFRLHTTTP